MWKDRGIYDPMRAVEAAGSPRIMSRAIEMVQSFVPRAGSETRGSREDLGIEVPRCAIARPQGDALGDGSNLTMWKESVAVHLILRETATHSMVVAIMLEDYRSASFGCNAVHYFTFARVGEEEKRESVPVYHEECGPDTGVEAENRQPRVARFAGDKRGQWVYGETLEVSRKSPPDPLASVEVIHGFAADWKCIKFVARCANETH
ncbi:hypothetical protein BDP81DRAFT_473658 [Colletotrichum phormii]|uniref:Uncharacterized protein n=1 Tax=Colletotrichum phormii TaxID=359342 RepID=A0AAJ0EEI8_9PEZI|nr:uncharacterized protein BDP81DRAFT_473658 [Colletotrichum phormii]KAK1634136.1 hypothetical protein BDP81DRAFT_473658 [Colletotrichum phormii]